MALQCNAISHWLGANLESALCYPGVHRGDCDTGTLPFCWSHCKSLCSLSANRFNSLGPEKCGCNLKIKSISILKITATFLRAVILTPWGRVTHICISKLTIIVAYMAQSHFVNQCWFTVNWTLRNKLQWNFNQNTKLCIHINASENIVCNMLAIVSRGRWVNTWYTYTILYLIIITIICLKVLHILMCWSGIFCRVCV